MKHRKHKPSPLPWPPRSPKSPDARATSRSKSRFIQAPGWLAFGTLAAYAVMGGSRAALAAPRANGSAPPPPAATLPLKRFDIAVGPLDTALADFEKVTGLHIHNMLPEGTLAGFRTSGVVGLYREEDALRLLLAGTGLNYRIEDPTTIAVGVEARDSVSVDASVDSSVTIDKLSEPLLITPQSIATIPQFVMQDEGISTLRDTLRNVPGISLAAGEAGAQGDNLTVRGFTARNDIFLDGIRDFGSYYRDSFNYEQVDALEGPAGIEFGRGSTGGVINQESKVPGVEKFEHVETQFGTDLTRRLTGDFNSPLLDHLGGTAFRLNIMGVEAGVAGRDATEERRYGIAPAVSIGLNTKTVATLSYEHLREDDTPDYGIPWLFSHPAPSDRHSYFGFRDENYLKTNDDILSLHVEHDFAPGLNVHTLARAANYPRQAQITEPQICSNASLSVPVGGFVAALPSLAYHAALTCPYTADTPADEINIVNRNQIQTKSVEGILWDQTEVSAHFKTFGIRHNLVAGAEGGQEISNPTRSSYTLNGINTVPFTSLVDPDEAQPFSGTGYITSVVHTKSDSIGVYFIDTAKLGRFFDLSGGVRWDRFNTSYNLYQPTPPSGGTNTAPVAPTHRLDEQPSYRAALVFKPGLRGSFYFDYGTSWDPDAESLSLSVGLVNGNVAPEENSSYEAGAKWSFLNQRLLMEGAWFRTEKDNAHETSPTNSNNIVAAGNQLVRGAQASMVGRLPDGMDLVVGYAYLDSDVLASRFFPTAVGYPLANVPRQTFNLFVTRNLPLRFNAGLGSNYIAARTASSTVPFVPTRFGPAQTFALGSAPCGVTATTCYPVLATAMKQVPGYWAFNAMIKRPITEKIDFQANVNNVLNRYYIDLPHPSHLIPAAGASALFGVNFHFK